ncbi:MAG TPA: hypothetical protein VLW45_08110 [Pelomicrobium sp.]|nr:hypothetical protein [Pelomicrobium sp.]
MRNDLSFDPSRTLESRARDCRSEALRRLAAAVAARFRARVAGEPRSPAGRIAAC